MITRNAIVISMINQRIFKMVPLFYLLIRIFIRYLYADAVLHKIYQFRRVAVRLNFLRGWGLAYLSGNLARATPNLRF